MLKIPKTKISLGCVCCENYTYFSMSSVKNVSALAIWQLSIILLFRMREGGVNTFTHFNGKLSKLLYQTVIVIFATRKELGFHCGVSCNPLNVKILIYTRLSLVHFHKLYAQKYAYFWRYVAFLNYFSVIQNCDSFVYYIASLQEKREKFNQESDINQHTHWKFVSWWVFRDYDMPPSLIVFRNTNVASLYDIFVHLLKFSQNYFLFILFFFQWKKYQKQKSIHSKLVGEVHIEDPDHKVN